MAIKFFFTVLKIPLHQLLFILYVYIFSSVFILSLYIQFVFIIIHGIMWKLISSKCIQYNYNTYILILNVLIKVDLHLRNFRRRLGAFLSGSMASYNVFRVGGRVVLSSQTMNSVFRCFTGGITPRVEQVVLQGPLFLYSTVLYPCARRVSPILVRFIIQLLINKLIQYVYYIITVYYGFFMT